jgi:hypothetical protein
LIFLSPDDPAQWHTDRLLFIARRALLCDRPPTRRLALALGEAIKQIEQQRDVE